MTNYTYRIEVLSGYSEGEIIETTNGKHAHSIARQRVKEQARPTQRADHKAEHYASANLYHYNGIEWIKIAWIYRIDKVTRYMRNDWKTCII